MSELKSKTIKGLFWSFADSFGSKLIGFGFGIVIARILSPSDYGIMGMIAIFIGLGNIISESGFGMALIQKKDANEDDYSTVFWFNLGVAILIYLILFFSAEQIAIFFDQPVLVNVTKIVAFSIVLNSLGIIHYSILNKNVDFKKQTLLKFSTTLVSGIVGILLALKGFAVWSLVISSIASGVMNTFGIWMILKWRPKFVFSIDSFKSLYSFGYKIFLLGLSDTIFSKIYYPLIGKYFPASELGFYSKADGFYSLLVRQTAIAYGRVTFPAFALIQDEKERFLFNYLKTYRLLVFFMFPITMIAISATEPMIIFFITEKWLPVVILMKIFFIEGFFFSLYMLNINCYHAVGKSGFPLKLETIKKALSLLSIFIAFKFGVAALILGMVISSFIVFLLSTFQLNKIININYFKQLKEISPTILIVILCFFFDRIFIDSYNIDSSGLLLFIKVISLSILYFLSSYLINKDVMNEFLMIFTKGIKK